MTLYLIKSRLVSSLPWKYCFAESAIEIILGPQDETVQEGESASFPCFYNGTNDIPIWYIKGFSYSTQGLPERHSYYNKTLSIHDVQASDNGTTYRCGFLYGPRSFTATLTVVITGSYNMNY